MSEPKNVMDGDWVLIHHSPVTGVKTYVMDLGTHYAVRKDTPVDGILDSAAADRSNNGGKRWGDGRVIGTIPDAIAWSSGYMNAKKNGDEAWIKRFWNNRDNYKLRTFEGTV